MSLLIAEALRQRGIKRSVHFHADHFEPLKIRPDTAGEIVDVRHVEAWTRLCAARPYARKATAFYRVAQLRWTLLAGSQRSGIIGVPGDGELGFVHSAHYAEEESRILAALAAAGVELQFHMHHELWTSNPTTGLAPAFDNERWRMVVDWALKAMRDATGQPPAEWLFVHGCWSLAAGDPAICNITDEVRLLVEAGCIADFSFPAGRPWCNPKAEHPFTALPVNERKGFDSQDAKPIPLAPHANAFQPGRLLIWSDAAGSALSLDTLSRLPVERSEAIALQWCKCGTVIDDTLYLKTHAHSMDPMHWSGGGDTATPLASGSVAAAFAHLERGAEAAGCDVVYKTASETVAELKGIDK